MMICTIFSPPTPESICGKPAAKLLALAVGQNGRMKSNSDALLMGYVPVCIHHSEYVPNGYTLAELS